MKYITLIFALITTVCQAQLNPTYTQPDCTGYIGSIALAPTFGTGAGYSYLWDDQYNSTGATLNTLGGKYTVVVTDGAGEVQTETLFIKQPTQIHVDWGDIPNHVCLNEVVNFYVTPSGGTGQYTLTWSGAVTGSTLQNSVAVTSNSVMAIIEVKDDNLCTATSSRSVTSDPQVELDIGSVGTYDIYDGMSTNILVTASGGSSFDYTFVLSDASGAVVSTTYSAPGEFTSDITLYAGPVINETDYYTLLVYDINGCTSVTTSISVTNIGVMP